MITLGVPTLNRYTELAFLIGSAERGAVVPDRYVIIDNGGMLDVATFDAQEKITVLRPGRNLGVAASWNLLLRDNPEYVIISNDDVLLGETTIAALVSYAELHPDQGFLHGRTVTDGNTWSFFMQRKWLFGAIGPYDEGFWPAYFEDNDYGYRMLLEGQLPCLVPDCVYEHMGSATLRAYSTSELETHHSRFRANEARYRDKWGGMPHEERYTRPFGP